MVPWVFQSIHLYRAWIKALQIPSKPVHIQMMHLSSIHATICQYFCSRISGDCINDLFRKAINPQQLTNSVIKFTTLPSRFQNYENKVIKTNDSKLVQHHLHQNIVNIFLHSYPDFITWSHRRTFCDIITITLVRQMLHHDAVLDFVFCLWADFNCLICYYFKV